MERENSKASHSGLYPNKRRRDSESFDCNAANATPDDTVKRPKYPKSSLQDFEPTEAYQTVFLADGPYGSRVQVSRTNILMAMKQCYSKVTSIGNYDGHDPVSFCYIDEDEEVPKPEDHHKITYRQMSQQDGQTDFQVLPNACKNAWKKLEPQMKHELLFILSTFRTLWKAIEYRYDTSSWQEKTTPVADDQPLDRLDLETYGDPDPDGNNFLELLLGDKIWADLEEEFYCGLSSSSLRSRQVVTLNEQWTTALLQEMANGPARSAVVKSLEMIADLLHFLPESLAPKHCLPLCIEHFAPPIPCGNFSTYGASKSLSSVSNESISSDCSSPVTKLKRTAGSTNLKNSEQKCGEVKIKRHSKSSSDLPEHSENNRDIEVICIDKQKARGKYILLVKIFSRGDTQDSYSSALGKFKKNLVHVLQNQSEVFGLFVADTQFQMLRARRNFNGERIVIFSTVYGIHSEYPEQANQYLRVSEFQTLMMDIFSCFVYGMSQIDD